MEEVTPVAMEIPLKPQESDYFIDQGPSNDLGKEPHRFSRPSSHSEELTTTKGVDVPASVQPPLASYKIEKVPVNLRVEFPPSDGSAEKQSKYCPSTVQPNRPKLGGF